MAKQICCLCGSVSSSLQFLANDHLSGEDFQLVRCDGCGLMFVRPQPPVSDLARYYPAAHQVAAPAAYERMDAKPRVQMVGQLLAERPGYILDVGCGKGLLLAGLRDQGWQVAGVELSEASGRFARQLGIEICAKPLEACDFSLGSFDVITMFHSLEHMVDPVQTLYKTHALLKVGGLLVVEVPNAGSWYAKVFGGDWFHCDIPRHLFHFSRNTLTQALEKAGYRVKTMTTVNVQYDAFGAVQSLLNKILPRKNLLNDLNTGEYSLNDMWRSKHRWRDLVGAAISWAVLAIGFPVFALADVTLTRWVEGGTLRVVASKDG